MRNLLEGLEVLIDLHLHTKYSHGANSPREMYEAACERGIEIMGFSEHSPRPYGFDYTHEYREALTKYLPIYVQEVSELRDASQKGQGCRVLFGMEMDWLDGQEDFARQAAAAFDFDYLIGSVHFIGHWGFDDGQTPWLKASFEQCAQWYEAYFKAWEEMLASGLYNIAAHPDLIKIFSCEHFHHWLEKPESRKRLRHCLTVLQQSGMAMEISSAGLRKACKEIYPCAEIMELARELNVPVTLASDAHSIKDIASHFTELVRYARSFGFEEQVVFDHGHRETYPLPA